LPQSPAEPRRSTEGTDQDGKAWKASDLVGKKVLLLYFYPKDDTPLHEGSLRLRDDLKDNVEVVGVSFDSAEATRPSSPNTAFSLLADTSERSPTRLGSDRRPQHRAARQLLVSTARSLTSESIGRRIWPRWRRSRR
jgi:peroxiredoxin